MTTYTEPQIDMISNSDNDIVTSSAGQSMSDSFESLFTK